MDFEKYYKIDHDGSYNLHFLNKDKLTVAEIKNIFSAYGKVLNVNVTKDEGGLRFVKYRTYQEAMCCLKGLQGSKIQLLPERSKMISNKKDCNQQQPARIGNSFQKPFNDYKQLNSNFINDENLSNRKSSTHIRTFNENNGSDNFSDNNHENSVHDYKPIQNAIKDNEQHSSVFDGRSSLPSKQQTFMENDSLDTIIDYEKYYRISRDDTYTVHFANKKGLTSEKIKELFSPYGNVVSVHSRGENNGLKFVRYKTLEEVISCLKGLQNSNLVSLLPQKDKIMGETKSIDQSSYQWQTAKTEDTSQKTFSTGKQFNLKSTYNENNEQKFLENKEKPIYNTNIPDKIRDKFEGSNFSDTSVNSKQNFNANGTKHKNTSSQMFNEKYTSSRQQNLINYKGHNKTIREKQQEAKFYSIMTETDTKMDRNMRISTHDYKMPALISDSEMKSKESDAMSDSSLSSETKTFSSKIVFIPMQEIIVANIHSKYGVHYILHLFEKYSPISATLVKTIPETNIRYCHIYFKSAQDAEAVEEEFDNFDLFGKNLIVLRKSRLIDETK